MEVAGGEGDDEDEDSEPRVEYHPSCSISSEFFPVFSFSSSATAYTDCPASSNHIGHHHIMVEDILRAHQMVGYQGDCGGIWASLVLAALQNSLGDPLPIFRASFQLHGHSGGLVDYYEESSGRLPVGAVPIQGDGDSIGWGVDGYCAQT